MAPSWTKEPRLPLVESPSIPPVPMHSARTSCDSHSPEEIIEQMDDSEEKVFQDLPPMSNLLHMLLYLAFNIALTIFNKLALKMFPYPFLLTSVHAFCSWFGSSEMHRQGFFTIRPRSSAELRTILAFSVLYTANIAISNVSLNMVTIPFHQVVRGTAPVFTAIIYRSYYGSTFTRATYLCLVPVMAGVGLATYGDYYYTGLGVFLTVLGTALACIKTIATNRLQTTGMQVSALELLHRMSLPALAQSLAYAHYFGETAAAYQSGFFWISTHAPHHLALFANGLLAFGLNVVSFVANKKMGALSMAVAANVKQALLILLGASVLHTRLGLTGGIGILLTLVGGAFYAKIEVDRKQAEQPRVFLPLYEENKQQATGQETRGGLRVLGRARSETA